MRNHHAPGGPCGGAGGPMSAVGNRILYSPRTVATRASCGCDVGERRDGPSAEDLTAR